MERGSFCLEWNLEVSVPDPRSFYLPLDTVPSIIAFTFLRAVGACHNKREAIQERRVAVAGQV